jgi:hypothetical protein
MVAGGDYQAAGGTLTFAPGETTKTITVLVNGDRLGEPATWYFYDETFNVNLSQAVGAVIADSQGVGTIRDDEPRMSIIDARGNEGNSGTTAVTFTVGFWAAYDLPVTVNFATHDGTATPGGDYQPTSGMLTFAPGETGKTISVPVNGDRLGEGNETFFVSLSNLNYGYIADNLGQGTIVDDEPQISISNVWKSEGKRRETTYFTFTVTLSVAYDQPVTMSYRTADGTATTSNSDYVAKSGSLTFAPGETTKTITIEVLGDSRKEVGETFYLDLFGLSSNALFTKSRGIGTIVNDD